MPARRSFAILSLLLFVIAFPTHSSPKISSPAAAADADSRVVVFEGFYRPT